MDKNSKSVPQCQVCSSEKLESVLFLGYLPPVNKLHSINKKPAEQPSFPAELLYCQNCFLVQIGLIVNKEILFPSNYPYTSSTTKILRDNFADLYSECSKLVNISSNDLIVDIGSNDGNLLNNFKNNHRVLGITPEKIGNIAIKKGIPTIIDYFTNEVVSKIIDKNGKAKIITATNVFAHIDDVNLAIELILKMLSDKGVFVSESHYLLPLIKSLQYDTIYHEHMRYYSLHSLKYLFDKHEFEIFNIKEIPSHGGSIRVYCAKKGEYKVRDVVKSQLNKEASFVVGTESFKNFEKKVVKSKLKLLNILYKIKNEDQSICAIGAPSRGSTLINYVGIDNGIIDFVCEIKGSHKIGKFLPGTIIPIIDEDKMLKSQTDYALLLSWHISDELVPRLRQKGFKGKFIIPLPDPKIIEY